MLPEIPQPEGDWEKPDRDVGLMGVLILAALIVVILGSMWVCVCK